MNLRRPFSPNRLSPSTTAAIPSQPASSDWLRWLLLLLILAAFGRLVWQLDLKTLWWDESLSLQRAESGWADLLLGRLSITDGVGWISTRDQHPFTFFLLLRAFIGLAGQSEFVLRFPSVMAATLLVPTVWIVGRRLARAAVVSTSAPVWAALLTAVSPFFLWYGQEARPYALWAWLGLLTTYLLMRWVGLGQDTQRPGWGWAYVALMPFFLLTHYFGVLLLAVHALLIFSAWVPVKPRLAWGLLGGILVGAAALGGLGGWWLLGQPGAGSNLSTVSLGVMLRDMLNAYSLGLSVQITQVWWLDLIYAGLAGLGVLWGVRRLGLLKRGGWLLPAYVILPVLALYAINLVQPAYMNARHLGLIAPAFLLLAGSGLGLIWDEAGGRISLGAVGKTVAVAVTLTVALILLVGVGRSTVNYFTDPAYSKGGRLDQIGENLRQQIQPGDLILVDPAFAWRIFDYYLPLESAAAHAQDADTGWRAVPLVGDDPWPRTFAFLDQALQDYRRIWLVTDGTFAYSDPERLVEAHLEQTAFRVGDAAYFSPNAYLGLNLFLSVPPIVDQLPPAQPGNPRTPAVFGDQILLHGVDVGKRFSDESVIPVTLYWDPLVAIEKRYKYVLELMATDGPQAGQLLARTEREPYNGFLPTLWWRPGPVIQEYTDLLPTGLLAAGQSYELRIAMYDADSLDKLSVSLATPTTPGQSPGPGRVDDRTLVIPFVLR